MAWLSPSELQRHSDSLAPTHPDQEPLADEAAFRMRCLQNTVVDQSDPEAVHRALLHLATVGEYPHPVLFRIATHTTLLRYTEEEIPTERLKTHLGRTTTRAHPYGVAQWEFSQMTHGFPPDHERLLRITGGHDCVATWAQALTAAEEADRVLADVGQEQILRTALLHHLYAEILEVRSWMRVEMANLGPETHNEDRLHHLMIRCCPDWLALPLARAYGIDPEAPIPDKEP